MSRENTNTMRLVFCLIRGDPLPDVSYEEKKEMMADFAEDIIIPLQEWMEAEG